MRRSHRCPACGTPIQGSFRGTHFMRCLACHGVYGFNVALFKRLATAEKYLSLKVNAPTTSR